MADIPAVARTEPNPSISPGLKDLVYRRDQARCWLTPPSPGPPALPEPTCILPSSIVNVLEVRYLL
jgi:hypothetical protein